MAARRLTGAAQRQTGTLTDRARRSVPQTGDGFWAQRIDPHRPRDILDALLAYILKRIGQPVAHLVANHPRDADPARLCKRLQTRRDVHPIAKDVVALDDYIAEIDSDAEPDAAVIGDPCFAVDHRPLPFGGAANGIDDASEFR